MKTWIPALLLLVFTACKNEPQNKLPDSLQKDEMPVPIRQLFEKLGQNRDSVGLRLQLIDALDSLGAYQQALGQMDSLILKDSLNYGLWYRKALLQENTKDTTGALRSYQYAIRIYPAPDALLAAANLLAEQKNPAALTLCKQVADLRLGRAYTAHTGFIEGIYYARTGNREKALAGFNQSIYNDLNYTEAYMEKGFLYYDAKQINEAVQVFQTLIKVKNTYADGYYWLAKCYEALNNTTEAVTNYQKAKALDPKLTEASEALRRMGVN